MVNISKKTYERNDVETIEKHIERLGNRNLRVTYSIISFRP